MVFALFSYSKNRFGRGVFMGDLSFRKRKKIIRIDIVQKVFIWIVELFVVNLLAFMLVSYLGKEVSVIGNSMESQLKEEDTVLVNRLSYLLSRPKRGDIVVFKPNGNKNSHYYIKRVVALPGETVQITDGKLVVTDKDGKTIENKKNIYEKIEYAGVAEEPVTLDSDEYFVMGDNFAFSEDSRYADIGNVKKQYIEGKVWCRRTSFLGFEMVR